MDKLFSASGTSEKLNQKTDVMETTGDLIRSITKNNPGWADKKSLRLFQEVIEELKEDESEGIYFIDYDGQTLRLQNAKGDKYTSNGLSFTEFAQSVPSKAMLKKNRREGAMELLLHDVLIMGRRGLQIQRHKSTLDGGLEEHWQRLILEKSKGISVKNLVTDIKVDFNKETGEITVENDGEGIDIEFMKEHNMYPPTLIFGNLLTGTNYDKTEEKTWGGKNGYGAKLANIFSTEFKVETIDSKRVFVKRDGVIPRILTELAAGRSAAKKEKARADAWLSRSLIPRAAHLHLTHSPVLRNGPARPSCGT